MPMNPRKATTHGMSGAIMGNVRPLTLDDSIALGKLPQILASVPLIQGNAAIEAGALQRRSTVYGVGHQMPKVWQFKVSAGQF